MCVKCREWREDVYKQERGEEVRGERGCMCVYVNVKRNSSFGYPESDGGDNYQQGVRSVSCLTCETRSIYVILFPFVVSTH